MVSSFRHGFGSLGYRKIMRFLTLFLFFVTLSFAVAQDEMKQTGKEGAEPIPKTLAEAHVALERILPPGELAKIDSMRSEKGMIEYHMGLGMWMRNHWGLWGGGSLAKHMEKLGFNHPDDMSGVILETFWCKRHGKDFRLKQRAAESARYWKAAQKADKDEKKRVTKATVKMRSMMMGLGFTDQEAAAIRMPDRSDSSLRARFVSPYRNGVFIAVKKSTGREDTDFVNEGYYFDRADRGIHKVQVPELPEIHTCVVAGKTAWFAGVKNGTSVLLGINSVERTAVPLPLPGKPPQLGVNQKDLLAVYPNDVFRLAGDKWEHLYACREGLPKSGPPPELHDNLLFLRDEGSRENSKRLWWLGIRGGPKLTSLDQDVKVVGSDGPRWENCFSYAVTTAGDLWACVGEGSARKSLLRRSKDGRYSIAIMNNSVEFTPDLFGSEETDQGISVSAVTARSDGAIVLVGDSGLYRLTGKELTRELAFENTRQKIPLNGGKNVYHWGWDPSNVIELGRDSYFITGAFGGIYLLGKDAAEKWRFESFDEHLGDPVVW
jgi:hypothetical protein